MKKTPLKKGSSILKKSSLKSNRIGLERSSLSVKTQLKKQNDKSKEKWEKIRSLVLERDNHKCVVCGKPATQVHHIHLRSKRKDLIYELNNLVSLCDRHHDHQSSDGLERVNRRIAEARHITLEQLLRFAEITEELKNNINNAREYIQSLSCLKYFKEGEENGTND